MQPFCILAYDYSCYLTGERQAHINIADGKKTSVILESEAAKMDQVNRAQGWFCYVLNLACHMLMTPDMGLCYC